MSIARASSFQSGNFSTKTLDNISEFQINDGLLKTIYLTSLAPHTQKEFGGFRIFWKAMRAFSFTHQGKAYSGTAFFNEDGSIDVDEGRFERPYVHTTQIELERYVHTPYGQFVFDESFAKEALIMMRKPSIQSSQSTPHFLE